MRKIILSFLLAAAVFAVGSEAIASEHYSDGYVSPGGYTYRGGLWYYGTQAYTRHLYTQPGYYSYGYYYQPYTYYKYFAVTAPAAAVPNYTDPGWRAKLLSIAAARDKAELSIRKGAVEHAEYMEALNALGLKGGFAIQGYGQHVSYPANYPSGMNYFNNSAFVGSYGANGNSLYGYNYSGMVDYKVMNPTAGYLIKTCLDTSATEYGSFID